MLLVKKGTLLSVGFPPWLAVEGPPLSLICRVVDPDASSTGFGSGVEVVWIRQTETRIRSLRKKTRTLQKARFGYNLRIAKHI